MCLVTIFTKRVSDSKAGQAEAQHCNQSQNIHMAQPSFLRFPCGFLCKRRGALRPVDAGFAPTETECRTQSLRRGLTAYHPGSPKEILTHFDRNFNQVLFLSAAKNKFVKAYLFPPFPLHALEIHISLKSSGVIHIPSPHLLISRFFVDISLLCIFHSITTCGTMILLFKIHCCVSLNVEYIFIRYWLPSEAFQ